MGSWKVHKTYNKFVSEYPHGKMDKDVYDDMVDQEKGRFHGFILMACGNISTDFRRQRFYATFVARYHGLSRKGSQLMSHYGLALKPTTYDKMEQDMVEHHKHKLRYVYGMRAYALKYNVYEKTCTGGLKKKLM